MANALDVAREVFEARNIVVPETPLPDDSLEEMDTKGRAMMQTLHGERSQGGYAAPTNARIICALAAFTALNLTVQLEKFLPAALNIGLSKEEVIEVLIQTAPYSGFPKALNALALAEKVLR